MTRHYPDIEAAEILDMWPEFGDQIRQHGLQERTIEVGKERDALVADPDESGTSPDVVRLKNGSVFAAKSDRPLALPDFHYSHFAPNG